MTIPPPPSCSVDALADWLADLEPDSCERDIDATARAVRALLDAKCRATAHDTEVVFHPDCEPLTAASLDTILARVLGAP